jgi:hypothetical protein
MANRLAVLNSLKMKPKKRGFIINFTKNIVMNLEDYKKALKFDANRHILAKHTIFKDKDGDAVYSKFDKQKWPQIKEFTDKWVEVKLTPAPIEAKKVVEQVSQQVTKEVTSEVTKQIEKPKRTYKPRKKKGE